MFLVFPNFNIFSTPLLILVSQGILFGILLLLRFRKKLLLSDLFLALLVVITCYHRTTYTIGFMDWYDTYRNTKVNYYLIAFTLAIGPLIFFYVKSVTQSNFKFRRKDALHFLPAFIYFLYRTSVFAYDAGQEGFNDVQNGVLMEKWVMGPVGVFFDAFTVLQQLVYLAFSFQLYYSFRNNLNHYFSNTYKLQLLWIRNFLFIYSFLYLYGVIQQLINVSIFEMSWIEKWWYQFFSALAVIYIGIKGYFTDTSDLQKVNIMPFKESNQALVFTKHNLDSKVPDLEKKKAQISKVMDDEKPYLNPDLNLIELAKTLNMNRAELSAAINAGFSQNFNDFINSYRINAVLESLQQGKHAKLSLLGVALECGFNSKATFNRVFKKIVESSPSEYIKGL